MGRFNTKPVSSSGYDVTAWVAGETRLTHEEALEVHRAVNACGLRSGKKRGDRERDVYKRTKYGLLPVIGIIGWLRICWWVWSAVQLLLDYYDERSSESSVSSGD